MSDTIKVLLIGGTSHVGKSTIATRLAGTLGWNHLSTDQLARHPGRPWRNDQQFLPDDVIAHYSQCSTRELVDSVVAHYQKNVWPIVDAIVRSHLNNPYEPSLVFEGSAILPELVSRSQFERCSCIWLTAADDLIRQRILNDSQFENRTGAERPLIEAFLERTLAFNEMVTDSANRLGQRVLDVSLPNVFDELVLRARAHR